MTQANLLNTVRGPLLRWRFEHNSDKAPVKSPFLPWHVKLFLAYMAAITIIGKGPTYIGIPPVYWGEVVMALGVLLVAPEIKRTIFIEKTRFLTAMIVSFMALGTVLTVISFPKWGLDAIRDAAMWYYGLFYFIGIGLAARKAVADRVWYLLCNIWLLSLVWNTADLLSNNAISHRGPIIPGRGINLFFNATHEAGQNLALGALLVLCTAVLRKRPRLRIVLTPIALVGLLAFAANQGRGMRVGMASGALVVLLLSFAPIGVPHFNTRLMKLACVGIPFVALIVISFPNQAMKLAHIDRFVEATSDPEEGTTGWRLIWWRRLYEQVMKRNPAFGLGFGESLSVYHPLLADEKSDFPVRSPHNFNITVFTRMGIVGLVLWVLIVFVGIGSLCGSIWRGSIDGHPYSADRRDELTFWVVMLVCTVVNGSLGLLMEGPVLGIWFWFALGFASARSFSSGVEVPSGVLDRYRRIANLRTAARGSLIGR